jgi:hypothetical protein
LGLVPDGLRKQAIGFLTSYFTVLIYNRALSVA